MDIQRLRNMTTGILHTEISHVYEDLESIIGDRGLMTHMLPMALNSVEQWLREHVTDQRFWDGEHDTTHIGEYQLPQPTAADMEAMFDRYKAQPNPLEGKSVVVVRL